MTALEETPIDTQPLAPTPASSWPTDLAELRKLPSGGVARLRRPSLMRKLRNGEIPADLAEAAASMLDGKAGDYQATGRLLAFMVAAAFVEPRCVYEGDPQPGEISVEQLSDADQAGVLVWINSAGRDFAPFRGDGPSPGAGGDGRDLRDEAE